MHKTVGQVFKILGLSLIFMFLLDTALVTVETINVHSEVSNLAITMQKEIVKNNSMPEVLSALFTNQLKTTVDKTRVASEITTNFKRDVRVEGKTYHSLDASDPSNVKQYGELADLIIQVEMTPTKVYFNTGGKNEQNRGLLGNIEYSYTLNYTYTVPCLRYLK